MDEDHFNQEAYCLSDDFHYSEQNHCLEVNATQGNPPLDDQLTPHKAHSRGELDEFDPNHLDEQVQASSDRRHGSADKEIATVEMGLGSGELQDTRALKQPDASAQLEEAADPGISLPNLDAEDPPEASNSETITAHPGTETPDPTSRAALGQTEATVEPSNPQDRRREGYQKFLDWNMKTRNHLIVTCEILSKVFSMYQKKSIAIEIRANLLKQFFETYFNDMIDSISSQKKFADQTIHSFEIPEEQLSMAPLFEQGISFMLKTIQSNHKNLVDLKKNFQASIGSLMNKSFTKHKEYFDLLERCHEHLNNIKQLSDKSLKEFEQFKQTYSAVSGAGKKSRDKDCFFDASRFSHSIRAIVRTLKQFCDDLIALKPLAVSKDNEALKILIKAFREFTSFTQKNFGPTLTSNLLKAKFVFDQINDDYSVESEYCIGDVLTDEELETIAATRDMLNKEIKFLRIYLFDGFGLPFPENHFMLHTFAAKVSTGTFLAGLSPCKLVLTVDCNLIVTVDPDRLLHQEPIECFKKDLYVKELSACLTYSKKGVLFNSNKEIRITFASQVEVDSFRQAFLSLF